jgi:hypothetical protein
MTESADPVVVLNQDGMRKAFQFVTSLYSFASHCRDGFGGEDQPGQCNGTVDGEDRSFTIFDFKHRKNAPGTVIGTVVTLDYYVTDPLDGNGWMFFDVIIVEGKDARFDDYAFEVVPGSFRPSEV